jgi:hypothetical protein
VAGITLVSSLCRSCQDPDIFNKASVKGFIIFAGSDLQWSKWPPWPDVALIPRKSAGRWLYPWPTQIVIPMTLALETGEVSWDSMGLRQVLFLAELNSHPSKSQSLSSNWKVVDLQVEFCGVSPAISGHAGARLLGTCAP